jgi:hypothetical protein
VGHERVGLLPKTERWRDLVERIASVAGASDVADLAGRTTELLRGELRNVQIDRGVQAAFYYLVLLGFAARDPQTTRAELSGYGIEVPESPTPLDFVRALRDWVGKNSDNGEYGELATRAAGEAICTWFEQNRSGSRSLFERDENAFAIWHGVSAGSGFCELARQFFARFTERHLNYYLEREASAAAPSLEAREALQRNLKDHIDRISRHAFETAKITQSFAAGWFNKRRNERRVSGEEIENFLRLAFGKIRDELLREGHRV